MGADPSSAHPNRVGSTRKPIALQIRNVIGTSHLIFLLLVGCNEPPPGDKPPPETSPPTTTTSTPQPVICDPPLSIAPAEAEVAPYQLLQLIGAGGTGQYRYALEAPSVGDINASAGTYIAPGEAGGADVVILTDTQCTGEATATISIVDGLTILPTAAQVLPDTAFDFEVTGGVGSATCALVEDGSGGTVDAACHYIAGPAEGTDIIEAIDTSGATAQAQVTVTPDATLAPMGPSAG